MYSDLELKSTKIK